MIEVKSPPRKPSFPTTVGEICNRAEKFGNYFGKKFYYCEVENNFLKIFRVGIKENNKVYETKDAVLLYEAKRKDLKDYERFWVKLDLCEFVLDFSKKKDYYNRKYVKMFGIPLYKNGKLHPFYKKKHKTDYKIK